MVSLPPVASIVSKLAIMAGLVGVFEMTFFPSCSCDYRAFLFWELDTLEQLQAQWSIDPSTFRHIIIDAPIQPQCNLLAYGNLCKCYGMLLSRMRHSLGQNPLPVHALHSVVSLVCMRLDRLYNSLLLHPCSMPEPISANACQLLTGYSQHPCS